MTPAPGKAFDLISRVGAQVFGDSPAAASTDGPLPSSHNGSLRGVSLAAEGAPVLGPGRSKAAFDFRADNNLLRETVGNNQLLYKAETHSYKFDYRRGLGTSRPVEVGFSAGIYQQDEGFLNGFITGFENGMANLFGPTAINGDRSGPYAVTGTVENADVNGVHSRGNGIYGPRLGDVVLLVKTVLAQAPGWTISERAAATIATGGPFSKASSVGVGVSAQRPLSASWVGFADAAAVMPASSHDRDGLALNRRPALDATAGVNYRATENTTLTAQIDYAGSPYAQTGLPAYDNAYTDVMFGIALRLARATVVKIYGAEDFNTGKPPPGQDHTGPYGPADFTAGVKVVRDF